jgi:hypothetical protein
MRGIDSFSEARAIKDGEPRIKRASSLGGVLTIAAYGAMAAVAATLVVQYANGNFIVLSSVLPVSPAALAGVAPLPHRTRVLTGPGRPPELPPTFASGLLVRISAQGLACVNATSNVNGSSGLSEGSWDVYSLAEASSELHTFDFVCAACTFGPLSLLEVSLDGRCQTMAVVVAAVGAQGGVTLYSFAAAGSPSNNSYLADFSLAAPPTLDVLYDTAVLRESVRGLLLVSASADELVPVAVPPESVRVRVSLASDGSLVQTRVDAVLSLAQLLSSITGLAGLLGLFATAFTFADGNRPLFRKVVAQCQVRCCCCCFCCRGAREGAEARHPAPGMTTKGGTVTELAPLLTHLDSEPPQPTGSEPTRRAPPLTLSTLHALGMGGRTAGGAFTKLSSARAPV